MLAVPGEEKGIPVKSTDPHMEGHAGFFADPTAWGASVVAFLKAAQIAPARYTRSAGPRDGAIALPRQRMS